MCLLWFKKMKLPLRKHTQINFQIKITLNLALLALDFLYLCEAHLKRIILIAGYLYVCN